MSKYSLVSSNVPDRCIECDLEHICAGDDPIDSHMPVDQTDQDILSLINSCKDRVDNTYIKYKI